MTREEFLDQVESQIRCEKAHTAIREELKDHIEDQEECFLQMGKDKAEAEELAVKEMGDPVVVGTELDKIHRPKVDWILPAMALGLSVIGVIMQCLIFPSMDNSVVQNAYPWRTIFYNFVGFGFMLFFYFLDYRLIARYAGLLWAVLLAIGFCIRISEIGCNYKNWFMMSNLLWKLQLPIVIGIIYRFREQRLAGLLKSIGVFVGNTFVFCFVLGLNLASSWYVYMIAGSFIILYAIIRNHFGGKKGVLISTWMAVFVGIPGVYVVDIFAFGGARTGLATYQIMRLRALFEYWIPWMESDVTGNSYVLNQISMDIQNATLFGTRSLGFAGDYAGAYSEYVLTGLISYWGIGVGILVIGLIAAFLYRALRLSNAQKNMFGKLLGMGLTVSLLVSSFFSVLANLGFFVGTSIEIPFLSYGKIATWMNYIYLGLILSVYRYSFVFGESVPCKKFRLVKTR